MNSNIQNRITREGKDYELLSGPWKKSEQALMISHLSTLKNGNIAYVMEQIGCDTWIYRDAKGYLNSRDEKGIPYSPIYNAHYNQSTWTRPKKTPYRQMIEDLEMAKRRHQLKMVSELRAS